MIDFHSHIIPKIDDGSKSIEETYDMLLEAKEAGFTDIIMTSHFTTHYCEPTVQEINVWKEKLQELLRVKNVDINLHSGMEIYVSNRLEELICNNKILTIENSKYILMELPINASINYLDSIIYILESHGLKLILAHPERYLYVQSNPTLIEEYKEKGILIQCNYGSIIGQYGKKAEHIMKMILKKGQVDFLGSDCHGKNTVYKQIPNAVKKIKKIITEEEFYKISTQNPKNVLENKVM